MTREDVEKLVEKKFGEGSVERGFKHTQRDRGWLLARVWCEVFESDRARGNGGCELTLLDRVRKTLCLAV